MHNAEKMSVVEKKERKSSFKIMINCVSHKEINPSRKYIKKQSIVYKNDSILNSLFWVTSTFEIFLFYR